MHFTQFKSAQIKLKRWKLVVHFCTCSWLSKGMKFSMWHRIGIRKGHPIWFLRFTHSLLPSPQSRFDLPTKNGFQWTSEIGQSLPKTLICSDFEGPGSSEFVQIQRLDFAYLVYVVNRWWRLLAVSVTQYLVLIGYCWHLPGQIKLPQ